MSRPAAHRNAAVTNDFIDIDTMLSKATPGGRR
jgi:hypothetical protein